MRLRVGSEGGTGIHRPLYSKLLLVANGACAQLAAFGVVYVGVGVVVLAVAVDARDAVDVITIAGALEVAGLAAVVGAGVASTKGEVLTSTIALSLEEGHRILRCHEGHSTEDERRGEPKPCHGKLTE